MSAAGTAGVWERLQLEFRAFPWRDTLPRMGADVLLVNASMVLAFVFWFFFYTVVLETPYPEQLSATFRSFVKVYWVFWSLMALLIFHLNGFYLRTRGYASKYKAWVIFRAVTLFIILFVFTDYFLFRGNLLPRGVALTSWLFLLVSVGGTRLAKDTFLKKYRLQATMPNEKVERVLVVGGAGYVGSILTRLLLARGYKVRVLDSFFCGTESLEGVTTHPNCEIMSGDIRNIEVVVQAVQDCDAVIHLAAVVGDPSCEGNKDLASEINKAATRLLVEVARGSGVKRFLFASTCSVYGASDFLMDEHTQIGPVSAYAQTKAEAETVVLASRRLDFHPTILRLGTLFGLSPRPRFDLVVNLLAARAAMTGKITIFNGEQWRPFVHVHDAARVFVSTLEADAAVVSGEIFNAGDYSLNHRLSELGEKIQKLLPNVELEEIKNDDVRNYRVSFDKLRTRVGFSCEKTLEDGIQEVYDLVRSGKIPDIKAEQYHNHALVAAFMPGPDAERLSLTMLETLARNE